MIRRASFLVLTAALLLGCRDIERFDTEGEAAYCGSMVSAQFLHDGFIPDDGRPDVNLRLDLTMAELATSAVATVLAGGTPPNVVRV